MNYTISNLVEWKDGEFQKFSISFSSKKEVWDWWKSNMYRHSDFYISNDIGTVWMNPAHFKGMKGFPIKYPGMLKEFKYLMDQIEPEWF